MERLAEDRKGPSSMEHKKRQSIAALETNVKVCLLHTSMPAAYCCSSMTSATSPCVVCIHAGTRCQRISLVANKRSCERT